MKYDYIDTHAHVNINAFKDDWQEVIENARSEGVMVSNVGTQQDTSRKAVEIAESFEDGVFAIVGLHPVHTSASYHDEQELGLPAATDLGQAGENMKGFTSRGEVFDTDFYRELAKSEKVVGIGETGFDYYRLEEDTKEVQEQAFIGQVELANELNLPLMIHTRKLPTSDVGNYGRSDMQAGDVYDDTYEVLKRYAKVPGNVHFYSGTYGQAKKFFDIGFTVSFTGVITFTEDYNETVKNAPLDMIHAETDCPYVAPVPYRGKRCEPAMVREVYKKITEIRGEDEEVVRPQLLENAKRLYKL